MWGRSVQCDSDGRETGAAGNERDAVSAVHADRVPGAGCGWSEGRGAVEGGGGGATPGRGCVGGGGRFPHQESAGRSRQSEPAGWNHRACPSNLPGKTKHKISQVRTTNKKTTNKKQ